VSAAGQASVQASAGQASAVGQVLVPRLAGVPSNNVALRIALVPTERTTSRARHHCTKRSQHSPSANCSCWGLLESEVLAMALCPAMAREL